MSCKHIVIVDDDPTILELLRRFLSGPEYRISVARRASVARSMLLRDHVDLVLTDARLPGENGIELTRAAEELGIPALIMSGDEEWALSQGADATKLLLKPFGLIQAEQRILAALNA
ncbi:MAG: two component response regulator [Rhodospirillales bacterium]|jgi:DNA-binding response OmpR family regulator|nr:two component response regulator [Rhodospirillales bacterium]